MKTILDQCQWPDLAAKYDSALRLAVGFIAENLEPIKISVKNESAQQIPGILPRFSTST